MLQQIESTRLILVPFTAKLMRLALHDKAGLKETLGVDIPDDWPNPDAVELFTMLLESSEKDPTREVWNGLIIHKELRMLIGDMGLKEGPDASGTVDIGYSIVPQYWNHGYATEMAKALVAWAFEQPGIQKVTADCDKENIGSIRVLEKLGMRQIEPTANLLNWSLTKEEWNASI
jgi:[ribosomal protein S5]-alanine N-acetyltransferase